MCHELTGVERSINCPVLPAFSRAVARVDNRHVLNGIFRMLRSGAP